MKKVLIITYYWPPAGGPGVQRWLKFARYLPENGFEPIIYTPSNPQYPIVDEALVQQVPPGISMVRRPIFEPGALTGIFGQRQLGRISSGIIPPAKKQTPLQKLALWVRGNLFIPDARKFWVRPSVKFLNEYLRKHKIDTVITTGPPHSLHLIGLELKAKNPGLHWVADFRDPWTTIGYQSQLKLTRRSAARHAYLEKTVLAAADDIVVTSPSTAAEFKSKTSRPVHVVTNGFDVEPVTDAPPAARFAVSHIGSLLSQRNPAALWDALAQLTRDLDGFSRDFTLQLVGAVSPEVTQSIKEAGLGEFLDAPGYVSHQQAVNYQRDSAVLLLIEIDSPETKSIIPGKLFEYMASGRPVLALGPDDADFSHIIRDTQTGIFARYGETNKIKTYLEQCYLRWKQGQLKVSAEGIQQYSRQNLTRQLAQILGHGNRR